MKILIINENLTLGGIQKCSVASANALAEQHQQTYLAAAPGVFLKNLNKKVGFLKIPQFKLTSIPRIINRLVMIIQTIKPDIIHCQGATLAILAGRAIKKSGSQPLNILTRHSRKFTRLPRLLAVYALNKYCDCLLTISQSSQNKLIQEGIKCPLCSIPVFVDCQVLQQKIAKVKKNQIYKELNIKPTTQVVIMVSRLIPTKRPDKFIKILAQVAEQTNQPLAGIIIGDGPCRPELEKLIQVYKSKVKIFLPGFQKDISKYLAISKAFLFPSEHPEVLPRVLIEASAIGLPIICSNIPGNNEIVQDQKTGFLINHRLNDYAACLVKLFNNPLIAQKISQQAQKTAWQRFDKKVIIQKTIHLYQNLLQRKKYELSGIHA